MQNTQQQSQGEDTQIRQAQNNQLVSAESAPKRSRSPLVRMQTKSSNARYGDSKDAHRLLKNVSKCKTQQNRVTAKYV